MAEKRRFSVRVSPKRDGLGCAIYWGDGARTICKTDGVYNHIYSDVEAEYSVSIVGAREFDIGSGERGDPSREMLQKVEKLSDEIESIPDGCFKECSLGFIHLPTELSSVGASAFYNAVFPSYDYDDGIFLPKTIKYFGEYAFYNNTPNLLNLAIPITEIPHGQSYSDVKWSYIGDHAIDGNVDCFGGYTVNFVNTVEYIGSRSMAGVNGEFHFRRNVDEIADDGLLSKSDDYRLGTFFHGNVGSIGSRAFNFKTFRTVEFRGTVGTISPSAFSKCEFENGIVFARDVGNIGNDAFVNSGDSIIGSVTFNGAITGDIGAGALSGIEFDNISLSEVASIGDGAFAYSSLDSISVGKTKDVTIGDRAFYGCMNLTDSIEFGANVKYIGSSAFSRCSNAYIVKFYGENPPDFGEHPWSDEKSYPFFPTPALSTYIGYDVPQSERKVYIPKDSWGKAYQYSAGFSDLTIAGGWTVFDA